MSNTPAERLVESLPTADAHFREGYLTSFLDKLARDIPAVRAAILERVERHEADVAAAARMLNTNP
jgi:hypothetical protein